MSCFLQFRLLSFLTLISFLLFAGCSGGEGNGGGGKDNFPNPGSLDTSFGVNGKIITRIGKESSAQALAVREDGKIVVSGSSWNNIRSKIALARYQENGNLDTTFGNGGTITTSVGSSVTAKALDLQQDGKIIVAGSSSDDIARTHITLVRYNTDGSLDQIFGTGGKVVTSLGIDSSASSLVIQSDGKILVAGRVSVDIRSNIPIPVLGITSAIAVAVGDSHTCALLADGTVRCWGGECKWPAR